MIRNTIHTNSAFQKMGSKFVVTTPQKNSLISILNSMGTESSQKQGDSFNFSGALGIGTEGYNSKMIEARQKMNLPSMISKFKRGEEFTDIEMTFIKKTKGGVEALNKVMGEMKAQGESQYITGLLDKYKVSESDRAKMVIDISQDKKSGAFTLSISGLADGEISKKISDALNGDKTISHGKNLFEFNMKNAKNTSALSEQFLSQTNQNSAPITSYLAKNGFTGAISSLDVKDGKITGLPEKLDAILNNPKLSATAFGKPNEAFEMKKGILKSLAFAKINEGKEIPAYSAKITMKNGSLSVIEQPELMAKIKNVSLLKTTDTAEKQFKNDPISWYNSVVSAKKNENFELFASGN